MHQISNIHKMNARGGGGGGHNVIINGFMDTRCLCVIQDTQTSGVGVSAEMWDVLGHAPSYSRV